MRGAVVVLAIVLTLVASGMAARTVWGMVAVLRLGQPVVDRTDQPRARTAMMLRETLGHTRMLKWTLVGAAHWFVFVGFGFLFLALVTAYGQLFDPRFGLVLIGHWPPFEWLTELIAWLMLVSIGVLIGIRQSNHPRRAGRVSRFAGSNLWQAYYVEYTIVIVGLCILGLRALEYALLRADGETGATAWHFPLTWFLGRALDGTSVAHLEAAILVVAAIKIAVSMAWLITIALTPTMGVAWHRFSAFANIFLKRNPTGAVSLGPLQPMRSQGELIDFEDPGEDDVFGVGVVEDFTWKGLLGLHFVHRVRAVSVAVPGVEHRKAALAQAPRHGLAGPRIRQGALPPSPAGGRTPRAMKKPPLHSSRRCLPRRSPRRSGR